MLLPATPGWVSLPVVVGGRRHSWLGSAGGGGVWCVVAWPGRAGLPPGRVLVRLTFSFGRFVFMLCLAPSGLGLPPSLSLLLPFLVAVALCFGCFFFFFGSRCLALRALAPHLCLPLGRWLLFGGRAPAPLPFCVSRFSLLLLGALVFLFFPFFFFLCAPPLSPAFSGFQPRVPWASRLRCLLCWPAACRLSVRLSLFRAFRLAVGCSLVVAAPPPPFVSRAFRRCRSVQCAVLCCASLGAVLRRAAARFFARCCAVVCCVALVWCRCLLPCALRRCVLRCSPALCVFCRGAVVRAVCVLGCCAVRSLCSPLCAVLCFAVLVRSRCAVRVVRAVVGAWCCGALLCVVLFPVVCPGAVLGLVARGCLLVAFLVSVSLSGRVVCFPVVGVVCCGAPLSCVVFCGAVLSRGAVLLCSAVMLRAVGACFALLWAVVLCCVVLLVGCAVFCPVVVSACCGALLLVLCVPCLLRSVRCGALLCWLWCPASLCCVLWRCAVVWCCAVVLCCPFAVLFVFALPSCGLSCGACVVCAVVGASCCGVSLCVVVSPWAFCGVVVLLWCVVVSCCAVRCPVVSCALCRVLRCRAALRCCAGWLCCAVVCAAGVCSSFCPLLLC